MRKTQVLLALLAALAAGASAHEIRHGELSIAHPFVTVDDGTACDRKVTHGYLMLVVNSGRQPDRLTGATLDRGGAGRLVRLGSDAGDAAGTVVAGGLAIAPGATVAVMPPAYAIEFPRPKQALVEGGMVRGTLSFERAGQVPVEFMVQAAHRSAEGAGGCAGGAAHHH